MNLKWIRETDNVFKEKETQGAKSKVDSGCFYKIIFNLKWIRKGDGIYMVDSQMNSESIFNSR